MVPAVPSVFHFLLHKISGWKKQKNINKKNAATAATKPTKLILKYWKYKEINGGVSTKFTGTEPPPQAEPESLGGKNRIFDFFGFRKHNQLYAGIVQAQTKIPNLRRG